MADSLDILLAKRFIERRDVKAVQKEDGSYSPDSVFDRNGHRTEDHPWKMGDIRAHLDGSKSFGHYLISQEGKCKLFAFDVDLKKEGYYIQFEEDKIMDGGTPCNPREVFLDHNHPGREKLVIDLRLMGEALAMKIRRVTDDSFPIAVAYSGNKGIHVYGLMGSVPAGDARQTAIEVLRSFNAFEPIRGENFWVHNGPGGGFRNLEIEVFPKQDDLDGKDLGNLMRLPLGVNRKSGQRAFFLDPRCGYNEFRELDPMVALGEGINQWLQ